MSVRLRKAEVGYEGELVLISAGVLTDAEKEALDIDPKDVPNSSYAIPRESYELIMARIEAEEASRIADEPEAFQDRWGTGGNHVAANPEGKYIPDDLVPAGKNPKGNRDYTGNISQGLIMYAPKEPGDDVQRPAVYDYFNAKTREDLVGKKLTLNINTTGKFEDLPAYMRDENGSQLRSMRSRKGSAFGGQDFEDALAPIDERTQKQIQRVAEDWSRMYGIEVEVVYNQDPEIDPENPHPVITYMGFTKGAAGLAGFANFPESYNRWGGQLAGYGHNPGFNVLNMDYTGRASTPDHEIYKLVEHELGHAMGKVHTHDLGITGRPRTQDLALSNMAYSDLRAQGVGPDGAPLPIVEIETGRWLGGLQPLNTQENLVVDLQELHKNSYEQNKHTRETRNNKLLPVEGIVADGKGAVLQGSEGNDRLDSNPGYASRINTPGVPVPQDFALVRGHFERIRGVAGDNVIIGAEHGDQIIEPGPGNNSVEFPHDAITGRKTIESTGKDTLVLSEALLRSNFRATQGADGVELTDGKNSIVLKGGVDKVQVIDAQGQTVLEQETKGFNAQDFQNQVVAPVRSRQQSHVSQVEAQANRQQAGGRGF